MNDPFVGRQVHRLDSKGRVAVPASIRNAVWRDVNPGIVLFPDTDMNVEFVHGSGVEGYRAIAAAFGLPLPIAPAPGRGGGSGIGTEATRTMRANPFAKRNQVLGRGQWSVAEFLPFDKEGRVVLPPAVLSRCHLENAVCFVGCNETFQVWNPARLEAAVESERTVLEQYRTMIETFDPWQVDADVPDGAPVGEGA